MSSQNPAGISFSEDLVSLYMENRTQRLKKETPKNGFKATDFQIMGEIMFYLRSCENHTVDTAYAHAFTTVMVLMTGSKEDKEKYNIELMKYNMWLREQLSLDLVKSIGFVLENVNYIEHMIKTSMSSEFEVSNFQSPKESLEELHKKALEEKCLTIIDLETRKAEFRHSNLYILTTILAFCSFSEMTIEEATDYSILTFVLTKNGNDEEKVNAHITVENAIKWEWDFFRSQKKEKLFESQKNCSLIIQKTLGLI